MDSSCFSPQELRKNMKTVCFSPLWLQCAKVQIKVKTEAIFILKNRKMMLYSVRKIDFFC